MSCLRGEFFCSGKGKLRSVALKVSVLWSPPGFMGLKADPLHPEKISEPL